MDKKIILASASPRRKDLLRSIGLEFEVITSKVEENIEDKHFSYELVEELALEKVLDVSVRLDFPAIVIGSDTVVVVDSRVLGKPKDDQDAFGMLKMLSGRTHRVISAIAVYDTTSGKTVKTSVTSDVEFKDLSDDEIWGYIKTGEPMDKAGAYAIQGKAGMFVKGINGCYSNIVGISVFKVAEVLKEFGVSLL